MGCTTNVDEESPVGCVSENEGSPSSFGTYFQTNSCGEPEGTASSETATSRQGEAEQKSNGLTIQWIRQTENRNKHLLK